MLLSGLQLLLLISYPLPLLCKTPKFGVFFRQKKWKKRLKFLRKYSIIIMIFDIVCAVRNGAVKKEIKR